jgi:hypothetical protein
MGFFTHTYDVRAIVELEDGTMAKVKCPVEARWFVTAEQIKRAVIKETEFHAGCKVVRIIKFYDASEV